MGNDCSGSSSGPVYDPKKAPTSSTHTLFVNTGDKKGAETDGNVSINLLSEIINNEMWQYAHFGQHRSYTVQAS